MAKITEVGLPCFIELAIDKGVIRAVHGVREILSQGTEEGLVIELGDVPLPKGVRGPENAITTLFGFRSTSDEISRRRAESEKVRHLFVNVDLKARVQNVKFGVIGKDDLPTTEFLPTERLAVDVRGKFMEIVNAASEAAGKRRKAIEDIRDVGRAADALGAVIKRAPFKSVSVLTYAIREPMDGDIVARSVASAFRYDDLVADVRKGEVIDRFMSQRIMDYLSEDGTDIKGLQPEEIHYMEVAPKYLRRLEQDPAYVNFDMHFKRVDVNGQKMIVHDWDGLWKGRKVAPLKSTPNIRITAVLPPLDK